MRNIKLLIIFIFLLSCFRGEDLNDELIEDILLGHSEQAKIILNQAADLELQVLYTEIDRQHESGLRLITHGFRVDPNRYFYPAGSVRLFAAALALERIKELDLSGLSRNSLLKVSDSLSIFAGQSFSGQGVDQVIHRMLINGDNTQFDRLYDFLGQQYINEKLWSKGFNRTRVLNRLSIDLSAEKNRVTNQAHLFNGKDTVYSVTSKYNPVSFSESLGSILLGDGYYQDGKFVDEPMDFQHRNFSPLIELHHALIYLLFPEVIPREKRFNLTEEDRNYLIQVMEGHFKNDSIQTGDYLKTEAVCFAAIDSIFGAASSFKRTGVGGQALGFMVENGYWFDELSGVEFILSVVIFVNQNRVFNDGQYEYREIGMPIIKSIIKAINEYEGNKSENSLTNRDDAVKREKELNKPDMVENGLK